MSISKSLENRLRANEGPAVLMECLRVFGPDADFCTDDCFAKARTDRALDMAIRSVTDTLEVQPGMRPMPGMRLSMTMRLMSNEEFKINGYVLTFSSGTTSAHRTLFKFVKADARPVAIVPQQDSLSFTSEEVQRIEIAIDRLGTRLLDYFGRVWGYDKSTGT